MADEGEGGTGEDMYIGVPASSSVVYSSQSISMKECLEELEDIGLSERIDMKTKAGLWLDTPCAENEEEAS